VGSSAKREKKQRVANSVAALKVSSLGEAAQEEAVRQARADEEEAVEVDGDAQIKVTNAAGSGTASWSKAELADLMQVLSTKAQADKSLTIDKLTDPKVPEVIRVDEDSELEPEEPEATEDSARGGEHLGSSLEEFEEKLMNDKISLDDLSDEEKKTAKFVKDGQNIGGEVAAQGKGVVGGQRLSRLVEFSRRRCKKQKDRVACKIPRKGGWRDNYKCWWNRGKCRRIGWASESK